MSTRLIILLSAWIFAWLIAFNSGRELVYNLAYLLTGVLALSYGWAWTSTRFISLSRYTRTRRSQVGRFMEESFEVRNQGRLPKLWLEVQDHSTLPFHEASRVVSDLRGHSSHRWRVRTYCQQRGHFRLGPLTLRSGDPMGLFTVEHVLPATSSLIVFPATVDLTTFHPPMASLSGGEAISRRTHYITTNVSGIREYAPGDSFNRIHWLSTARTGRLMAKEFELDPTADIWIFLDMYGDAEVAKPWFPSRPETGLFALARRRGRDKEGDQIDLPPSTTEYAVTVAASTARYFLLRNRAVGLITEGQRREVLQADRGHRQLTKLLEALAVFQAEGKVPFAQLLSTDGTRLNRNDTILAISADPTPTWARALRELRRRGVHSIAIALDGNSFGAQFQYGPLYHELEATGIATYLLHNGERIDEALSQLARIESARR